MTAKLLVLMSTYNGKKFLEDQLNSILSQKDVNVSLLIRDDGSFDGTQKILEAYATRYNNIEWYQGKNLKTAKSFMDLIKSAKETYDYYAFADQDDVWKTNKLSLGIKRLQKFKNTIPLLYCANYQLVDSNLNKIESNSRHYTTTNFKDALVFSNCTGCTIIFNKELLDFLKIGMPANLIMHDDWTHKVCLAVGGKVLYDTRKVLYYRQHTDNVDGGIHSLKSKIIRVMSYLFGKRRNENSNQLKILIKIYQNYMPQENLNIAQKVLKLSSSNILDRYKLITKYEFNIPKTSLKYEFILYNILKCW